METEKWEMERKVVIDGVEIRNEKEKNMGEIYVQINEKMDFDQRRFDGSAWRGHIGHGGADVGGVWMTRYLGNGANLERLEIEPASKTKKGERVKVWLCCADATHHPWIQGKVCFMSYDYVVKKLAALPESEFFAGPPHIYSLLFDDFEEAVQ